MSDSWREEGYHRPDEPSAAAEKEQSRSRALDLLREAEHFFLLTKKGDTLKFAILLLDTDEAAMGHAIAEAATDEMRLGMVVWFTEHGR